MATLRRVLLPSGLAALLALPGCLAPDDSFEAPAPDAATAPPEADTSAPDATSADEDVSPTQPEVVPEDPLDTVAGVDASAEDVTAQPSPEPLVVKEGPHVIPQTKLHLSPGQMPLDEVGEITWTVIQPPGSKSRLLPSPHVPEPTIEANVAGDYVISAKGTTTAGEPFEFASYLVQVVPDAAIHIELLWSTPLDEDETDEGPEAGADLDLHFLHPFATGYDTDGDGVKNGWFDNPYDTYWFNPNPEWSSFDPWVEDNPSLDLDDTDGAGPENINLHQPEPHVYRVGVHYWSDHGFGHSEATVRVYLEGQLAYATSFWVANNDLCEVARINWVTGEVLPTDAFEPGGVVCGTEFIHPLFAGGPP